MVAAALESRGHETLLLPTMLLSGTYDMGAPAVLDTTDYLLEAVSRWEAQGVCWDCLLIGGVTGLAQAQALCGLAEKSRACGAWVLLDPILGDGGKPYASVTAEQTEGMRRLARCADVVTPNLTEACLLTQTPYEGVKERADAQWAALEALSRGGDCSAIITSAALPDLGDAILGLDARTGERFASAFARVPGRHLATGDLFGALLADGLLRGRSLREAAEDARDAVAEAVRGEGTIELPK